MSEDSHVPHVHQFAIVTRVIVVCDLALHEDIAPEHIAALTTHGLPPVPVSE